MIKLQRGLQAEKGVPGTILLAGRLSPVDSAAQILDALDDPPRAGPVLPGRAWQVSDPTGVEGAATADLLTWWGSMSWYGGSLVEIGDGEYIAVSVNPSGYRMWFGRSGGNWGVFLPFLSPAHGYPGKGHRSTAWAGQRLTIGGHDESSHLLLMPDELFDCLREWVNACRGTVGAGSYVMPFPGMLSPVVPEAFGANGSVGRFCFGDARLPSEILQSYPAALDRFLHARGYVDFSPDPLMGGGVVWDWTPLLTDPRSRDVWRTLETWQEWQRTAREEHKNLCVQTEAEWLAGLLYTKLRATPYWRADIAGWHAWNDPDWFAPLADLASAPNARRLRVDWDAVRGAQHPVRWFRLLDWYYTLLEPWTPRLVARFLTLYALTTHPGAYTWIQAYGGLTDREWSLLWCRLGGFFEFARTMSRLSPTSDVAVISPMDWDDCVLPTTERGRTLAATLGNTPQGTRLAALLAMLGASVETLGNSDTARIAGLCSYLRRLMKVGTWVDLVGKPDSREWLDTGPYESNHIMASRPPEPMDAPPTDEARGWIASNGPIIDTSVPWEWRTTSDGVQVLVPDGYEGSIDELLEGRTAPGEAYDEEAPEEDDEEAPEEDDEEAPGGIAIAEAHAQGYAAAYDHRLPIDMNPYGDGLDELATAWADGHLQGDLDWDSDIEGVWGEGWDARDAGSTRDDNPYHEEREPHHYDAWGGGWNERDEELADEEET